MATHVDGNEYDVVFAGGGTAACVAAGRLALADRSLSILLVEGGKNNLNDPTVTTPALYLSHLAPNSQAALFYKSEASEELLGREAIVPSGGILGGGSSINFMMYTRAQAVDYDAWNTEGWDFKSVLPSFKRFETYHPKNSATDYSLHGSSGPINISRSTWAPQGPEDDLIAAGEALGLPEIIDEQDFHSIDGQSRWARYVSPEGVRQDAAHRYIHPLLASGSYPNLHLLVNTKVSRVLLDDNQEATGVEVLPTPSAQPVINLSKPIASTIKARKLVIVSAGALGSPSVLERSGIGAKEILEKAGVECRVDVPGVGENYQDHNLIMYPYKTSLQPDQTLDGILSGRLDVPQAMAEKNPILGWNGVDIAVKLRPSAVEVDAMGADFQAKWARDFAPHPERPLMLIGVVSTFLGDHSILPPDAGQQFLSMGTYTAYPYSRGSIHIASADPLAPAEFHAGFLRDEADVAALVWAYKKQREIYRRTNAYQGELGLGHPVFQKGSRAALADGPLSAEGFQSVEERRAVAELEYQAEDDVAIEKFVRENVQTTWHSMGTCRMGAREEGGVLDSRLNVHGTKGLKVVDLSICPGNVAANTNNTALMVGERAAEMIIQELGLVGRECEKVNGVAPTEDGFAQASL